MPSLPQLRKQIDLLDNQIVALLNHRLKLAEKIGGLKLHNGDKVYNPSRERELLSRLCGRLRGPLLESELRIIYQRILQASRAHQKRVFLKSKKRRS